MKISQHENFAVELKKTAKLKRCEKMHLELNYKLKCREKIVFAGNRKINMHKRFRKLHAIKYFCAIIKMIILFSLTQTCFS